MPHGMSRRRVVVGGLTLAGAAALLGRTALADAVAAPADVTALVEADELPWPEAQAIVAETGLPTFPSATFNASSYGAVGNGSTDNTAAFRRAIDACNAAGGGTVVVPSGTYVTGAIYLRSNVNLRLDGATLKFSGTASNFPTVLTRYEGIECMNRSPMIYAYGERNIALTGTGTLDAANTSSWNTGSDRSFLDTMVAQGVPPEQRIVPGSGHSLRSSFIEPYNCDTVLIQGVSVRNPMFWQLHPTLSRNVTVDRVSTDPSTAHSNTDGCDPECCDHVVIRNCDLGAHDDNIAIKSGRDADGRRINVPCQNIVVFGCRMNGNWGAITCGSELTGGIRNVYAYNCTLVGVTKFALYVKSNTLRGGFAENINLDSFSGVLDRSVAFVTSTYNSQTGSFVPRFGPLTITNSSCTHAGRKAFDVSGLSNSHVRGFTVRDGNFSDVVDTSNTFSFVDNLSLTNVWVNGARIANVNPILANRYEAESATISQGVLESTHAGYSGTGYVNYDNVAGSYVQWTVNAAAAGTTTLILRYANGTTTDRPMDISVNGTVVASGVSFASTGVWTNWQIKRLRAVLQAGANTIRATATTVNGGPNLDFLETASAPAPPPPTTRYEAEDATISQGVVESNHTGFSGTGFVNYTNVAGSYVQWTVTATAAGTATLALRYANGTTTDRPMDISVNGTVIASGVSFPSTGVWDTWQTATLTASLNAGTNTVRATATTANGGPNVDYLDVQAA
jgi:polygalacturonase